MKRSNRDIKIVDNFLDQSEFEKIQEVMMGDNFAWFYTDGIVSKEDGLGKFQLTHQMYKDGEPRSSNIKLMYPILNILKPIAIYRIKANFRAGTLKNEESLFHTDMGFLPKEKVKQWTTSIFYINTNDGYTLFKNGTKVESVSNRMVTFPADMTHCGTSCTNKKTRVVINFNYYDDKI
tara:strand:- start:21 stop:554 length:534 start_codon:yes stop_codon:yes gene_type:complete